MSLKAVELQVAIPRTQELSRQQDVYQQRLMHEQQTILSERNQLDEAMRHRPTDVDETTKGLIKEKQERERRKSKEHQTVTDLSQSVREREASHVPMRDPLRGRHVDIFL